MSPHTQGHPGPPHTVITVERERRRKRREKKTKGGMDGRQKTKKALPLKKRQPLREGCTTLFPTWFQIATTLSTYA